MNIPPHQPSQASPTLEPLYTPEQRLRRDTSYWTVVQGLLAPIQFLVFLVSVVLVVNFLNNGTGYAAATVSVVCKTALLLLIMVTGAIWEKVVFGQYLFAKPFYWEDMVSMVVIALHCAYVAAWLFDLAGPQQQMWLALAAYGAYVVNAAQFLIKFSAARRDGQEANASPGHNGNWAGAIE